MNQRPTKCTGDDTKRMQDQPNHTASVFWKASQAHQRAGKTRIPFLLLATEGKAPKVYSAH